jgi:hypothetical protein
MVLSYYELKHKGGQNGSPKQRRNEMKILAWTMIGLAFLLNPLTYLAGLLPAAAPAPADRQGRSDQIRKVQRR